jgi:hypothetical protein
MLPVPVVFRVALYVTEPERKPRSALQPFENLRVAPSEVEGRPVQGGLSASKAQTSRSANDGTQDY